jgi:hypothetical protein
MLQVLVHWILPFIVESLSVILGRRPGSEPLSKDHATNKPTKLLLATAAAQRNADPAAHAALCRTNAQ